MFKEEKSLLFQHKIFETEFAGRPLSFEVGKIGMLANGACLVRYGETTVMVNVTMSKNPREGIDFFPLSVDFEEKLYAAGKIPGSFLRREGRPSDRAILASRLVDRPMRPLFPKDLRNDVTIIMTVLSSDPDCSPEICGMIGASFCLAISDIPWGGPIAGIAVGLVDGKPVLMPGEADSEKSEMLLTIAGDIHKVCMIELAANQVPDDVVMNAIIEGHKELAKIAQFIADVKAEIGAPKIDYTEVEVDHDLFEAVKEFAIERVRHALDTDDKNVREERMAPIVADVKAKFEAEQPELAYQLDEALYKLQKFVVRRWLLDDGKRVDGRKLDEIRPLASEVGLIPRVHGSALFTRGQTQCLTITTLGAVSEAQILDGIGSETEKRYMHQYNFPSYSVGETRPSRGPGRREIGHGALSEKALLPVIPPVEEFPYAYRVVSEITSSNGSTSQASICASTLSLMDAGVPLKAPVAGISCGLVTEGDRWITMVDIQGVEDFFGDMDFKVAGTHNGITAIQVDIKIDGLTFDIIREAIAKTREARLYILDEIMLKALPAPRGQLSKYAPKMLTLKINPDKIREVIGSGGKVIQKITAECNCKIDIEDDGNVFVSAIDINDANRAIQVIKTIAMDPEVGAVYKGKVTRLMAFGAFVEIAPGKEGLVHISKLDTKRVEKVEDVVTVGDEILVKVTEIDQQGRVNLSRRDVLEALAAKQQNQ
ncbi:MAG: polyribonucleotide nucleotidyltransferase [Candidatus Fimivivens sp.]|nr:polyribonucleotide nucleotidyltransferase [Candidatus Fimivivens sp.]